MNKFMGAALTRGLMIVSSLLFLYTAGYGTFSTLTQRGLHWTLMIVGAFLVVDRALVKGRGPRIVDWVLAAAAAAAGVYVVLTWPERLFRVGGVPTDDVVMGAIAILTLLVALKRTVGWGITITAAFFLAYALYGPYFPGFMGHSGVSPRRLVSFLYMTSEGIFGIALGISATYIIVFVIFGAVLNTLGGGQWFVDLSYAVAGRFRGGPAKTAIVASGLMGMISGAPVANVATTGTFTIPLMKRVGYTPVAAAAIEAVASTGGMFLPPVMGAGAFIMAEYLGVPYLTIAAAAIVPAALYYLMLLMTADARAARRGLKGLPAAELPSVGEAMRKGGHHAIPLLLLIGGIVIGWSPLKAAFWSVIVAIVVAALRPGQRPTLGKLADALYQGSRQTIPIAMACAGAGIVVGVLGVTGLGTKIASGLVGLSGGEPWIALVMTMVAAIILGAGMPVTAVYIILAATLVQPLALMGIDPLAAHFFIFMFAAVAGLTPPVAITSYTAAGIAGADLNRTGWTGLRFGLAGFLIPFIFAFDPALLLVGDVGVVLQAIVTAALGVLCLVAALEGYLVWTWRPPSRAVLVLAAGATLVPGTASDLVGLGLVAVAVALERGFGRAAGARVLPTPTSQPREADVQEASAP
jgi:TRAP transporter 4TM/12TM fusion protein